MPQGSPLSPVIFLVYMAQILEVMECRIKQGWNVRLSRGGGMLPILCG